MPPRKIKERDKFWDENDPKNNLDYIEISLPTEDLDHVIQKYAPNFIVDDEDIEETQVFKRRKERLVRKIFQAASSTLTQRQLQVFMMRHVCGMKEMEIAGKLDVHQSYVSNVLKVCNRKIRKELRIET
jgi:DNA-directed RNA polymerase specialized sigma subunit